MNLKEKRKKMGLSQIEIAKFLGVDNSTYGKWELEKAEPNIENLIKLADYYHVTLDELVGRPTENVNLNALSENEAYLIRKILQMNDREIMRTKAFVMGLTEE